MFSGNRLRNSLPLNVTKIACGRAKNRAKNLLVEKILQAFNTWSFKREQPDNLASLHQVIGHAVRLKEAVPFVLYWGKGPRRHIGKPEITSLNYLRALAEIAFAGSTARAPQSG